MPDWDGWYTPRQRGRELAVDLGHDQPGPARSCPLLTPEYQKRMVQMNYHEGVDNSPQWEASFCYPEGFMRWWAQASQGGNFQLIDERRPRCSSSPASPPTSCARS